MRSRCGCAPKTSISRRIPARACISPSPSGGGPGRRRPALRPRPLRRPRKSPPTTTRMLGKLIAHAPTRDAGDRPAGAALDRTAAARPADQPALARGVPAPSAVPGRRGADPVPGRSMATTCARRLHARSGRSRWSAAWRRIMGRQARRRRSSLARSRGPAPAPSRPLLALQVRERADGTLEVAAGRRDARCITPPAVVMRAPGRPRWHVQAGAVDLVVHDASFEPAAGAGGRGRRTSCARLSTAR